MCTSKDSRNKVTGRIQGSVYMHVQIGIKVTNNTGIWLTVKILGIKVTQEIGICVHVQIGI